MCIFEIVPPSFAGCYCLERPKEGRSIVECGSLACQGFDCPPPHSLDMEGVRGSIPLPPTTRIGMLLDGLLGLAHEMPMKQSTPSLSACNNWSDEQMAFLPSRRGSPFTLTAPFGYNALDR
jgi:hypothetical protein